MVDRKTWINVWKTIDILYKLLGFFLKLIKKVINDDENNMRSTYTYRNPWKEKEIIMFNVISNFSNSSYLIYSVKWSTVL